MAPVRLDCGKQKASIPDVKGAFAEWQTRPLSLGSDGKYTNGPLGDDAIKSRLNTTQEPFRSGGGDGGGQAQARREAASLTPEETSGPGNGMAWFLPRIEGGMDPAGFALPCVGLLGCSLDTIAWWSRLLVFSSSRLLVAPSPLLPSLQDESTNGSAGGHGGSC
ncbi:hypothetical protein MBM_00582 [Drepanopeziza brunnea f. sp. 'multigermtubi' MB_m1]|uniref:Uncharacterized protein n=1 Tax=Marssonina brunnea f. sp. multigermtubi (strain MB_m1) TaxID=1072389 RepID=K1Y8I0_MARBU|nr:uncharacterized protein MBM_00582 [Drepanopeziza brunnea f. sp. 'multigermtubi' MB_m1]EKD21469.1 hypothetical protein MBM_00582 [Drepanopeziza brunnea f. sp. 'multigermtubi' MB_m1]